jgi:hypothetical protein
MTWPWQPPSQAYWQTADFVDKFITFGKACESMGHQFTPLSFM